MPIGANFGCQRERANIRANMRQSYVQEEEKLWYGRGEAMLRKMRSYGTEEAKISYR
jgi:hypothetical protein